MVIIRHICRLAIILVFSTLLCGCVSSEPDISNVRGVLDGWIGTNGYPVVVLTESISPEEGEVRLNDKVIVWGKVTISNGQEEVIMTGGPANSLFPPYRYYTFDMMGEEGKTYTVRAVYNDIMVESKGTILPATPIDEVIMTPISEKPDYYSLSIALTSPDVTPAYYYVSLRQREDKRGLPAFMSTLECSEKGRRYILPLKKPKFKSSGPDYEPDFEKGESWEITLNRVDSVTYAYWKDYNEFLLAGTSPFIGSTTQPQGNVEGGYGIWSVCGSSRKVIVVGEVSGRE